MNRRAAILLVTGCLSLLPVLQLRGQETDGIRRIEPGRISAKAHEALRLYFETALPAWTDTRWLQVEVDPIARARRSLRERMQQEAEKATLAAEETARPRDPQIVTERLRVTLGNNTDRSWSPIQTGRSTPGRSVFHCRAMPGPTSARPGKRRWTRSGAANSLRRKEGSSHKYPSERGRG